MYDFCFRKYPKLFFMSAICFLTLTSNDLDQAFNVAATVRILSVDSFVDEQSHPLLSNTERHVVVYKIHGILFII